MGLEEEEDTGPFDDERWTKADAYFDILAHDVTNLISPIMVHAEFISLDRDLPRDARVSAAKIVRLIRRTANFIMSFRMLHEAGSNPPRAPSAFDIGGLVKLMRVTVASEYPFKNPSISVDAPKGPPPMIVGAEFLGRMVMGLVDNAVRNASRAEVDVSVTLRKTESDDGRCIWMCEVVDDGPGIPDEVKAELVVPFETSKRLARRSPSSLMFYSAILEILGGRLRIEDRVAGDVGRGTRAIVEIPAV